MRDADVYLERLLARGLTAELPEEKTTASFAFHAVVDAYEAIRAISREQAAEWRDRWKTHVAGPLQPSPPLAQQIEDMAERVGGRKHESAPTFTGRQLHRVVIGPMDGPLPRLVSVELYRDGILARWLDDRIPPLTRAALPRPRLTDDCGTIYSTLSGGATGGQGHQPLRAEAVFVPAVPSNAEALSLDIGLGSPLCVSLR